MKNTRRSYALFIPLALATVALTGCSSTSQASGTYVSDDGDDGNSLVIIDGNNVRWGTYDCENPEKVDQVDEDNDSYMIGMLDSARAEIGWSDSNLNLTGGRTSTFYESEDGSSVQVYKYTYYKNTSDEGKQVLASWEEHCQAKAAAEADRKVKADAEQAEADAVASQYEVAATAVLDGLRAMSESELGQTGSPESIAATEQLLKKNSITAAEMMEYLGADPDVLDALIASNPVRGEVFIIALQMLLQQ